MVKDKEHDESFNAQKLWDWLKLCDLKSKSWFLLCVCWVFELLSRTWFVFSSISLQFVGPGTGFGSGETVTSRLQELKHWERHQTVRADHTGWAGSTKFRSFKILPLCSAAGLLTEVKKPWKCFEFQIDLILLHPSTNSVALHLPPTIGPKEWEECHHFAPQSIQRTDIRDLLMKYWQIRARRSNSKRNLCW